MNTALGLAALLPLALVLWTRLQWRRAERTVPPVGAFCPVEGGVIHFVEKGPLDAPVVVLIHGLAGQLQHMTYAMADDLAQDFRVVALDRPGCGYSRRDHDRLASLEEQARMIWQFLDAQGIKNPVLAGHSLGGALSLMMALQRPEAVRALALIAPATHSLSEAPEVFKGLQLRKPFTRRLMGHSIAVPSYAMMRKLILREVFSPEPWPEDFMTRGGAILGYRPPAFVASSADMAMMEAAMPRLQERYGSEPLPAGGILFGAEDSLLLPELHGKSMEPYGMGCELLQGRGHMLPITAARECCDFVRKVAAFGG